MTDPRKPVADAARAVGGDFNRPGAIAAFDAAMDARFTSALGAYATFEPFWNSTDHRPVFHSVMANGSGNANSGLVNMNWPSTYENEAFDVQVEV